MFQNKLNGLNKCNSKLSIYSNQNICMDPCQLKTISKWGKWDVLTLISILTEYIIYPIDFTLWVMLWHRCQLAQLLDHIFHLFFILFYFYFFKSNLMQQESILCIQCPNMHFDRIIHLYFFISYLDPGIFTAK